MFPECLIEFTYGTFCTDDYLLRSLLITDSVAMIVGSFLFSITSWLYFGKISLGIYPYHLGFKHVDMTSFIMTSSVLIFAANVLLPLFSVLMCFIFDPHTKA